MDKDDQMLHHYDITRKTKKWYRKLAFHLMNVRLLYSYCIYKYNLRENGTVKAPSWREYSHEVVNFLLCHNQNAAMNTSEVRQTGKIFAYKNDNFVTKGNSLRPKRVVGRCRVCSANRIRTETVNLRKNCIYRPFLCVGECFEA